MEDFKNLATSSKFNLTQDSSTVLNDFNQHDTNNFSELSSSCVSNSKEKCETTFQQTKDLFNTPIHFNYDNFQNLLFHDSSLWCYKDQIRTNVGVLAICVNIGKPLPLRKRILPSPPMIIGGLIPVAIGTESNAIFPSSFEKELKYAYHESFLRLQPRVRYIVNVDPTYNIIKHIYTDYNKSFNNERIFFYYNGYGLPDPDPDGKIYLSSYMERGIETYEKLSLKQLYTREKTYSLTVLDCSFSENVLDSLLEVSPIEKCGKIKRALNKWSVFLGATKRNQILPLNSELPTDIFTLCLTSPIEAATILHQFHASQKKQLPFFLDDVKKIPGVLTDRNTLLGEINWIYTAIVDTIAYACLPLKQFLKLYRGDLLLATLMRNFLLATRLLKPLGCNTVCYPKLPHIMYEHYLWRIWDYHFERTMNFIMKENNRGKKHINGDFFVNQLRSFGHWLDISSNEQLSHSEYLPQALQFLLGQSLRSITLKLICNYFDLGLWAIKQALSVGMFTYLVKLFGDTISNNDPTNVNLKKIKQSLFLWCKLTFFEPYYKIELLNATKYNFFIYILRDDSNSYPFDLKLLVVYIITRLIECPARRIEAIDNYGSMIFQVMCDIMQQCHTNLTSNIDHFTMSKLSDKYSSENFCLFLTDLLSNKHDTEIRDQNLSTTKHNDLLSLNRLMLLWVYLCQGILCENNTKFQLYLLQQDSISILKTYLYDDEPQMRAVVVFLFGNLIYGHHNDHANKPGQCNDERIISLILDQMNFECSTLVKKEMMIAIFKFLSKYHDKIKLVAFDFATTMNAGMIQILFNVKNDICELINHQKLKSLKKNFQTKLIDLFYSEMKPTGNMYTRVFQYAIRLLIDSSPEISKTTSLFMKPILPVKPGPISSDNMLRNAITCTNIPNDSLCGQNYKRKLVDKFTDSDTLCFNTSADITSTGDIPSKSSSNDIWDWNSIFVNNLPSCMRYESSTLVSDLIFRCSTFFMQLIMHKNIIRLQLQKRLFEKKSKDESNRETMKKLMATPPITRNNFSVISHVILSNVPIFSAMRFHAYQPILYLSQNNIVNIIDWKKTSNLNKKITNHSNSMIDITTMEVINEDFENQLLLTGSDDGVVKIWSLQNSKNEACCLSGLISSWKALPLFVYTHDMTPAVISAWNQRISTLCIGGWSDHVYCWDLCYERFCGSVVNNTSSSITSMSFFNNDNDNLLVFSSYNGQINVIDLRTHSTVIHYCDFNDFKELSPLKTKTLSMPCKVFPSKINNHQFYIFSESGKFTLFDIRNQQSITQCSVSGANINSCDYQPYHHRLFYQASNRNSYIVGEDGKTIYKGRFKSNLNKENDVPSYVSAKFHPYMSVLALYSNNGILNVVHTNNKQENLFESSLSLKSEL